MKITRRIYVAGKTIITREQPSHKTEKGLKRAPKQNITAIAVWKNNLKNAVFNLTLILNNNFAPGDQHLQLTYSVEPTLEQSKKDKEKFFRKLRTECRKQNIEIKWVAVTEYKKKRIHHHVICSNVPMSIVEKCWTHGIIFHNPLWDNPNYKELAEYLLKEASKAYENEGKIFKRRYNTSRNIVIPLGHEEEINRVNLEEEPKAFKGYYIDGEVNRYEHIMTRLTCREYIQVSLYAEPRIKNWYKGDTVSLERINYSKILKEAYAEQQEIFFAAFL